MCQKIIAQCRCMDHNNIEWEICEECSKKPMEAYHRGLWTVEEIADELQKVTDEENKRESFPTKFEYWQELKAKYAQALHAKFQPPEKRGGENE